LSLTAHEADIIANSPQHADHLFVHMLRMKGVSLGLMVGEQGLNINGRA